MGDYGETLTKGEVFDVLRNQRRRYALHALKREGRTMSLGDLAQQVAAWEYETTPEAVTPAQRKRVYTTLQQTHLPRMDRAGILEFDDEEGVVEPTDRADEMNVYLEIVPGDEIPWRELYLSLGAISCALVAVLWGEVAPFARLPTLTWTAVIAVTFTATAAVHVFYERRMRIGEGERPPELRYGTDE
ncbi:MULTISPECIES: DUF7344 domain-containing protein [Saliphagus]|uniref:DUF7344 domain-containing protein n=1 Tax=Saliphagus infecundisoli TaxID=1849069 RepID=A0ABD5Q9L1_9EURY|nr:MULTISPECIES: hypothetical protein [Saliphagus]